MNVSNMSTLFHLMEEEADTLLNLNLNDYTAKKGSGNGGTRLATLHKKCQAFW